MSHSDTPTASQLVLLFVAALMLAIAVTVLVMAFDFEGGSGLFPRLIGWIFVGLTSAELILQIQRYRHSLATMRRSSSTHCSLPKSPHPVWKRRRYFIRKLLVYPGWAPLFWVFIWWDLKLQPRYFCLHLYVQVETHSRKRRRSLFVYPPSCICYLWYCLVTSFTQASCSGLKNIPNFCTIA